ncbi:hypothetical protein CC80DRAFT_532898, partial [Byssothecium circinans]
MATKEATTPLDSSSINAGVPVWGFTTLLDFLKDGRAHQRLSTYSELSGKQSITYEDKVTIEPPKASSTGDDAKDNNAKSLDEINEEWNTQKKLWDTGLLCLEKTSLDSVDWNKVLGRKSTEVKIQTILVLGLGALSRGDHWLHSILQHLLAFEIIARVRAAVDNYSTTNKDPPRIDVHFYDPSYTSADFKFINDFYRHNKSLTIKCYNNLKVLSHVNSNKAFVITFNPNNPIRQVLADMCAEAKDINLPHSVICTLPEMGTERDETSTRVQKWLGRYEYR